MGTAAVEEFRGVGVGIGIVWVSVQGQLVMVSVVALIQCVVSVLSSTPSGKYLGGSRYLSYGVGIVPVDDGCWRWAVGRVLSYDLDTVGD